MKRAPRNLLVVALDAVGATRPYDHVRSARLFLPAGRCVWILWTIAIALLAVRATTLRAEHVPLGVVLRDETSADAFSIVNNGREPLLLARAESTCDCLTVDGLPLEVAPGEGKRVAFHYLSHHTGSFDVEVKLFGLDGTTVIDRNTVAGFVADRSWLLAPRQAQELAKSGDATFVDLRTEPKFASAHVARSINLAAFALKTRTAWRQRLLVLIDEGFAPEATLALAAELRSRGFVDIRVLDGGLPAWKRAGGALEGTSTSSLVAARVTPAEFARATATAEWRVFEVGDARGAPASASGIVTLANPEDVLPALAAGTDRAVGRVTPRVLVIGANDAINARIEALTADQSSARMYYLAGGRPALDRFLQQQHALGTDQHAVLFVRSRQAARPSGGCIPCGH